MKKFISVFMAVILAFGIAPAVYADEGLPAPNRDAETATIPTATYTMTKTVLNSGAPTSTVSGTINIGDTFDVHFDRSALNWSAGEFTTYSFTGFDNSWVKVGSSTTDIPVTTESITKSTETGAVTVRLKAKTVYSGTLKVYLDSGTTTTLATTAFSKQLTIQDPKAIAEAEEKARIEAEEKARAEAEEAARAKAEEDNRKAEAEEAARAKAEEDNRKAEAEEAARAKAEEDNRKAEAEEAARAKAEEDNRKAQSEAAATTRMLLQTQQSSEQVSSSQPSAQSSSSSQPTTEASSQSPTQPASDPQTDAPEATSQAPAEPLAAGDHTLTKTVNGGAPSSQVGTIKVGDPFVVEFDATAFDWSNPGDGYDFTNFRDEWVKVTSTPPDMVKTTRVAQRTTDGGLTVHLIGMTAATGTITVLLDSSGNGTDKTEAFTRTITVQEDLTKQPHIMSQTVVGGGSPTSTVGNTIPKGDSFDVVFDHTAFNWSVGNGSYSFTGLTADWVKLSSSTNTLPIELKNISGDAAKGSVTVSLRTTAPFTGTLNVALNSGATQTAVFSKAITITAEDSKITKTKAGGTAPTASHAATSTAVVGEKLYFTFPENNFEWNNDGTKLGGSLTDTSWIKVTGASATNDFNVSYEPIAGSGDVRVLLVPIRSGNYTNLQVYLQGGSGTATASSTAMKLTVTSIDSGKITGIASDALLGGTYSGAFLNGRAISYSDLDNLEVEVDDELLLPLRAGFFTWSGTAPYPTSAVSKNQLNSGKIKVVTSNRSGSKAFSNVKPDLYSSGGQMYVRVKFAKDLTSTKDIDFSMLIYLTVDGKRQQSSELELAGTLVREVFEAYDNDSYFDISDGGVVEADRYVKNVELYLGSGVTAIANLSSGRKYTGTATFETSSSDESMLSKYSALDQILTLKTSGLSGSNCKVQIDVGGSYYVYNKNLDYLGKSDQTLPYSNKYYLTTKKIDFNYEDVDDVEEEWSSGSSNNYIYNDVYEEPSDPVASPPPTNSNGNPKTGR